MDKKVEPSFSFTVPTLILYVRPRDRFDATRTFKIKELEAEARTLGLDPFSLMPRPEVVDDILIKKNVSATTLLAHALKRQDKELNKYKFFWFAGYGSSSFFRQMVQYVFEHNLEYEDRMDRGSPLKAAFRWYELHRELQKYRCKKQITSLGQG